MPLREFDSVKKGDQLPDKVISLTRQDLVNYAGVSGDLNPIHWDDDIAKQVGLDTAIAHGMLTMGLGGGYITSWRSEEHTSELQSRGHLVCRLLLEKKK